MSELGLKSGGKPAVSVVTPVYNGESFIGECIESVLAQDFSDWEYVVADNCSSDRTVEIAERYARRDSRIRVVRHSAFLGVIGSHNRAFRLISPASRYCKVVSADDQLLPGCVRLMVELADAQPSVGIVGSLQQSAGEVKWRGLPVDVRVIWGREICRRALLEGVHVFGNPTSLLYRSDLVRAQRDFFPHDRPHADTSACYRHLQDCDFGFVHEALSIERVHEKRVSTEVDALNAGALACIEVLTEYGPTYLLPEELRRRQREIWGQYYRFLGGCIWKLRGRKFWQFHESELVRLGLPMNRLRVFRAAIREFFHELRSPVEAASKLAGILTQRKRQAR